MVAIRSPCLFLLLVFCCWSDAAAVFEVDGTAFDCFFDAFDAAGGFFSLVFPLVLVVVLADVAFFTLFLDFSIGITMLGLVSLALFRPVLLSSVNRKYCVKTALLIYVTIYLQPIQC